MNECEYGTYRCGHIDAEPCCAQGIRWHLDACTNLALELATMLPDEMLIWPTEIVPTPTTLALVYWTLLVVKLSGVRPAEAAWGPILDWAQERPDEIWQTSIGLGRKLARR